MPEPETSKRTSSSLTAHAFAGALLQVLVSVSPLAAQTLPAHDYASVKNLIRVSAPEFAGNRYLMDVLLSTDFDHDDWPLVWRVNVREIGWQGQQGRTLLLAQLVSPTSARFDFPQSSEAKALVSITEQAAAHPEWTDTDLIAALHRAKAEYPPNRRDAFQAHLDVYRFAPILGAIRKVDVDFVWRRPEAPEIVVIRWRVKLETVGADGRVARYDLAFEPMKGRLTNLWGVGQEE